MKYCNLSNFDLISKAKLGTTNFKMSGEFIIYLYKLTNIITNDIYIGVRKFKGKCIEKDDYFGGGFHVKNNKIAYRFKSKRCNRTNLYKSLSKYGYNSFKKEILLYFDTFEDALIAEENIVDTDFLQYDNVLNMIEGGGKPPIGSGEKNNNFGNKWSTHKKFLLSQKLKALKHSKGKNNNKATCSVVIDLLNDKVSYLDYISQVRQIYPHIKTFSVNNKITKFHYYIVHLEKYNKYNGDIDKICNNYLEGNQINIYNLIKLVKSGHKDIDFLLKETNLKKQYIKRFFKGINYESN